MGLLQPRPPTAQGDLLLSVRGLGREGVFEDVNFDLHRGEVLGFGGLIGAGRTDVGLALFGIEPATAGTIVLNGKTVTVHSPGESMDLGIAYVSEDRRQLGLSMPMSISANITLPVLRRYLNRFGLIRTAMERATAEAFRERLSIRTASVDLPVAKLSGGNQQKVMLSKWLNTRPSVLILDEPTRGIDVGAKAEVHAMIGELAAEGIGIILISSDLPEVLAMSDRLLVMREGRQMAIFEPRGRQPGVGDDRRHGPGSAATVESPHEVAAALCPAGAGARVQPAAADHRRGHRLRLDDRRLLHVAHLQPHRLERRHHHHRRGRPDAGRADPQHRPLGRLDRRLHRLFHRHAARQQQRPASAAGGPRRGRARRRARRGQRRAGRLGPGAVDHRHAGHAGDLSRTSSSTCPAPRR